MPPPSTWAELHGARVAVWGLGVEGRATVDRLLAMGVTPQLVDDEPTVSSLRDLPVLATAAGGDVVLRQAEVVVKSPGISRYRADVVALAAAGVHVVGGVGLWLAETDPARVVGITGTKGKSTTASIVGHLLRRLGHECFVGGNLGLPPFSLEAGTDHELWVVELSSYQTTDLTSAPSVVVVTSLHPDHLNWHGGDVEQYYRDKLSVCTRPGARVTVADGTSEELRARRDQLGSNVRWVDPPADPARAWSHELGLRGAHNVRNAELARVAIAELGIDAAADDTAMAEAARGFESLPSRLTSIGTRHGIEFVDDSLSTNVLPTIAAVEAFAGRPLALIVGGYDRGIDYAELAGALVARTAPTYVIGIPDSGPRIVAAVDAAVGGTPRAALVETQVVDSLAAATTAGFHRLLADGAHGDGVVLLSPAAASFGHFGSYRERAASFHDAFAACAD
jgi:UDP-N-acetylmuramoylalanine--D-glutamate ligase